jgi:nucleotide-binding universal stress UspA family protein
MKNAKRVHWAFDPYSDVSETWQRSLEAIQVLQKSAALRVIPTYFIGHDLIHWVSNVTPSQVEDLRPVVEKAMRSRLAEFAREGIEFDEPKIVISHGNGRRKDAQAAADFFAKENSDLVILNTHARKNLKRWVVGSFAENLLLQCERPMLFISPHTRPIRSLDHVFYPTDFADRGFEALTELLENGIDGAKEVTFFSKVVSPITAFAQTGTHALGGGWVSLDQYVSDIGNERRHLAEKWKQAATARGLSVHISIDEAAGV